MATLDKNKGFINQCFFQKVNCKKTFWDQAKFSNLVWQEGWNTCGRQGGGFKSKWRVG